MGAPHRLDIRVYYEDTDFSGVVYHASYLRFLERGRTELLRTLGISQATLFEAGDAVRPLAFAVTRIEVDFRLPARMDDLVSVETAIEAVGGASLRLRQEVRRGTDLLVKATVKVAALVGGRPARLPGAIASRLAAALAASLSPPGRHGGVKTMLTASDD